MLIICQKKGKLKHILLNYRIIIKNINNINSTKKMKKRVFFLLVAALFMPWAINAQVNSAVHIDSTKSACDSYTWSVTGQTYTSSTVVTHVVGDTLYILDLTINPSVTNVVTTPVQGGCTFTWGDSTWSWGDPNFQQGATHTHTFAHGTTKGCDSTVTITLHLDSIAYRTINAVACDKYIFKGDTLRLSDTYTINDSTGSCDSVITLNLTVNPVQQKNYDTTVVACEKTQWLWNTDMEPELITVDGTVISSTQYPSLPNYIFKPRTAERCFDSIVTVTFNIKKNDTVRFTHQDCDSYTYFFSIRNSDTTTIDTTLTYTFSKSDTIRFARLAANGCDSVLVTNITINPSPVVTISGDLRVKPGSSCTLHASSDQNGTYFTWFNGSHESEITIPTVNENFDAYVNGKNNATGCEHTTYVTVMANQGINEADGNTISIYPNPTSAVININSNEVVKNVTVFNIAGQQVINAKSASSIDLSSLANGTYVVRVDLENGKIATRTVILSR